MINLGTTSGDIILQPPGDGKVITGPVELEDLRIEGNQIRTSAKDLILLATGTSGDFKVVTDSPLVQDKLTLEGHSVTVQNSGGGSDGDLTLQADNAIVFTASGSSNAAVLDELAVQGNTISVESGSSQGADLTLSPGPDGGHVEAQSDLNIGDMTFSGHSLASQAGSNLVVNAGPGRMVKMGDGHVVDVQKVRFDANTIASSEGDLILKANGDGVIRIQDRLEAQNLLLDGNTVSAVGTDGNIQLAPVVSSSFSLTPFLPLSKTKTN
jgi:hypothetical protein